MDSSAPLAFIILFVSCSLFFLPFSQSIYFKITRFYADTENINYRGDAEPSSAGIELNRVDWLMRTGQAKYAYPVQIWDRKSGKLSDFSTHFTFIVDTEGRSPYADAFSFFLAPVGFQIPPNSAGAFLGLFNSTNNDSPQNQMLVVEFDSFVNAWDPQYGPHVGINLNSVRSRNDTAWNINLHSGQPADAYLSYNATTQLLCLSWRYGAEKHSQDNKSLSYNVDLRKVLPEWVTMGFSGTTGLYVERHILQYWEFSSSFNSTVQNGEVKSNKWKLAVGLIVLLGVVVVGSIVVYTIFWKRQRKHTPESIELIPLTSDINDDLEKGAGPKRFSFIDLALATKNFSDKLGEGGSGCVYKGHLLPEGIEVAVKKISGKKEYITEVKIISNLRHRNLVQLIGWCHDQTTFLLVYEFLPNASLKSHLFSKKMSP